MTEICEGYARIAFAIRVSSADLQRYYQSTDPNIRQELAQKVMDAITDGEFVEVFVEDAVCTGP